MKEIEDHQVRTNFQPLRAALEDRQSPQKTRGASPFFGKFVAGERRRLRLQASPKGFRFLGTVKTVKDGEVEPQPSGTPAGAARSSNDEPIADQPLETVATPVKPLASCLLPASDSDKLFVGKAEMSQEDLGRVVSIFDGASAHRPGRPLANQSCFSFLGRSDYLASLLVRSGGRYSSTS